MEAKKERSEGKRKSLEAKKWGFSGCKTDTSNGNEKWSWGKWVSTSGKIINRDFKDIKGRNKECKRDEKREKV